MNKTLYQNFIFLSFIEICNIITSATLISTFYVSFFVIEMAALLLIACFIPKYVLYDIKLRQNYLER